ncbi:MAG: peptidylprolyl isomerase [Bacteroidota bacterium]|nr:peptidylprolyl isomerase [Bacteroidota bacterium]
MRIFAACVILLFQLTSAQYGFQSRELPTDTLATIGTQVVSAKDFLERFELMPYPNKDKPSRIENTKLEFLQSLVAEKLLAMDATAQSLGNDSASLMMQYNLERLFVRDELYKRDVVSKISVSESEMREGMNRYVFQIDLEVLGILSKTQGDLLYKKIVKSKNKTEFLRRVKDSLYISLDTLHIKYGTEDIQFENMVYTLGKDSVSKPFEFQNYGWVIVHLIQKQPNFENLSISKSDQIHKVEKIIRGRKEDSVAVNAFASVISSQHAEANPEMFYMLTDTIYNIMKADSNSYTNKGAFILSPSILDLLSGKLFGYLDKPFVKIDAGDAMTLRQVLLGFSDNLVTFPHILPLYIRSGVNNNIKLVVQNELLAREGMKRNLHQSENVRHDIGVWMDNRRGMLLLRRLIDSVHVTNEEIEADYRKDPSAYGATVLVKVREILVDSIPLAKQLRERIDKGEDFSKLAKQYSKRKEWAKHGGESDFIDVSKWDDFGLYVSSVKVGEVKGPWKIKDGLTIFTVLERKILDDSLRKNFATTHDKIQQKLLLDKRQKVVNQYIGALAKKYNVRMNEANLRKTETTSVSMVTWRYIGFGGKVIAVPGVLPQVQWVDEWKRQEKLNQ